jgi:hypothetical protein
MRVDLAPLEGYRSTKLVEGDYPFDHISVHTPDRSAEPLGALMLINVRLGTFFARLCPLF